VDREFVCLAILMGFAVIIRRRPGMGTRRLFLLISLLLTGVLLNQQYSSQQVMALLGMNVPGAWLSGAFFLVLLVPLVVLLFGNVYCGYVCPFGALQELIGDLRPARLAVDPGKRVWRYGRSVKYVLLLLLIVLFALTGDYAVLSADPLITVFSALRSSAVVLMGIVLVGLSFVYRRFWCRNLCPAGAFLAFLCGARLLKNRTPPAVPARCDLGVRAASELDCLCCDRCKHEES
jgi:polyferredoxin